MLAFGFASTDCDLALALSFPIVTFAPSVLEVDSVAFGAGIFGAATLAAALGFA